MRGLAAADAGRCIEPGTRTRAGRYLDQELLERGLADFRMCRLPSRVKSESRASQVPALLPVAGARERGAVACVASSETASIEQGV